MAVVFLSEACVLGAGVPLRGSCARESEIVRGLAQFGTFHSVGNSPAGVLL